MQQALRNWAPGEIIKKDSFLVKTQEGGIYRRNRTPIPDFKDILGSSQPTIIEKATIIQPYKEIPTSPQKIIDIPQSTIANDLSFHQEFAAKHQLNLKTSAKGV